MVTQALCTALAGIALSLSGCAAATSMPAVSQPELAEVPSPPPTAAAPPAITRSEATQPEATEGLPTECSNDGELCVPPRPFGERLCRSSFAGGAIRLFAKDSPFSRGYIRMRSIKATNTLGGPAGATDLSFGEEVIILIVNGGGRGGMQVSGMGGYHVLRWDGTCATLSDEELVTWAVGTPRHAPFTWKYIDTSLQEALLLDKSVSKARKTQRKHCRGVTIGQRSAPCQKADAKLNEQIVLAVRTGLELPPPDHLP